MTAMFALAYTPFMHPLPLDRYWLLLLVPMVIAIALVYKAIKVDDLSRLARESILLSAQILGFMALCAAGLWLITELA